MLHRLLEIIEYRPLITVSMSIGYTSVIDIDYITSRQTCYLRRFKDIKKPKYVTYIQLIDKHALLSTSTTRDLEELLQGMNWISQNVYSMRKLGSKEM